MEVEGPNRNGGNGFYAGRNKSRSSCPTVEDQDGAGVTQSQRGKALLRRVSRVKGPSVVSGLILSESSLDCHYSSSERPNMASVRDSPVLVMYEAGGAYANESLGLLFLDSWCSTFLLLLVLSAPRRLPIVTSK
jgi:hypothetical protein